MNKKNIEQIIRELFKDNYRAYPSDYDFSNDNGQQARLNARSVANEYWDNRQDDEVVRDEQAGVTKEDYVKWVMAELSDLIPSAPNKFQTWASEINKDWIGYKAEATEDALTVNFNSEEVGRIDYNNGRYTVTGTDKEAVEQLEYMVNR